MAFLDPPPAAAWAEARALLERLQALDGQGALTAHGRSLSQIPLPPRLAHMVVKGAAAGDAHRAALIAALLTERGLGGRDLDLRHRLEMLGKDRSPRARDARTLAQRWAKAVRTREKSPPLDDALLLAEAFPERIAKARGPVGEYQLASGRGVHMAPTDALARERWLAIGELGGGASRDRILLAAPLDEVALREAFASRLTAEDRLEPGPGGKLRAKRILRLDRLVIEERLIDKPEPALILGALLDQVRREGLSALPWGDSATALRTRLEFLRTRSPSWPDVSDTALLEHLDDWLAPILSGKSGLGQLSDSALHDSLHNRMPWDQQRRLEAEAPLRWAAPTGSRFAVDYGAEAGPRVEVRVQELYGLDEHPKAAGEPLTLALLSPAHRPIQITKDLPGFWRGSWKAVRTDMKGRYPRHVWPEEPWLAQATTRAKPRGT